MARLDLVHRDGNHCGSTSLWDLSTFYDWGFDEPACFGLGAGLGFGYQRRAESPQRSFFGRTPWLEWAFFEHLGIDHAIHEGQDFAEAWADVSARIDAGDPVMIFTDLYYLTYYGTDTHFAPHSLLVVGYDDESAHLADSEFAEIQELPLAALEAALTSTDFVPLQCRYLTVEDPTVGREFGTAAADAIREVATAMLDPGAVDRASGSFGSLGLPALREFAAELPEWAGLENPSWLARFAYQNVERRGTGGGAFRAMYADFLAQAVDRTSIPDDAPRRMSVIAEDWTALGSVLRDASEADGAECRVLLEEAGRQADALADREEALYEDLLGGLGDR